MRFFQTAFNLSGNPVWQDLASYTSAKEALWMWWNNQNLDKPRTDKSGTKWNFRVWHEVLSVPRLTHVARIFFWDEKKNCTGVVLLGPATNTHVRRIRSVIDNLVADSDFRARHSRQLRFPLERHYSDYGVFPEESEILKNVAV